MNNSHKPHAAMHVRARFVSRFVTLMNNRVDYMFETRLFTLVFIGLPTIFIFLIIPLHAFGAISDLILFLSTYILTLVAVTIYACLVIRHTRISSECIKRVFEENTNMRQVLHQSANAEWADVDAEAYA